MKKLILLSLLLLIYLPTLSFADEKVCENAMSTNRFYKPPAGWHITKNNLGMFYTKLKFYIATYNYDKKIGANGNRISCDYKDPSNNYELEITTDKTNIALPHGFCWEVLDATSHYCFPETPVDPKDCPWD